MPIMSEAVNVYEAKTHLSKLLDRVAAGEEIVIARSGRPVARLVPLAAPAVARRPGAWQGRVRLSRDFDELPSELAAAFRGELS
jgi:prevent-host-death family protein